MLEECIFVALLPKISHVSLSDIREEASVILKRRGNGQLWTEVGPRPRPQFRVTIHWGILVATR